MKTRRNPWFLPFLFYAGWTAVVGVTGYAAYARLKKHYDEKAAREELEDKEKLGKAAALLTLSALAIGLTGIAFKGGQQPPRVRG